MLHGFCGGSVVHTEEIAVGVLQRGTDKGKKRFAWRLWELRIAYEGLADRVQNSLGRIGKSTVKVEKKIINSYH